MAQSHAQIGNLTYNAATAQHEALVTFHTAGGRVRVAASVDAPLDADPEVVRRQLISDAMLGCREPDRLRSRLKASPPEPVLRAARPSTSLAGAMDWLRRLHAA
ncbi:hypothetical protein AL036_08485 [Salipiger aestuarii]|uniref:Uncharacterized protein n=1 Tax=Salipiger aestuarii TaxID=568098 RepID=A0A327Y893_9RHOB|nr:hypothetical protein [Salipiger aestuarii]EIE50781.1 hypothetical protein C357_12184 [Citreicella sp. 357]KAA8607997.1 hypothetical protein AL036_08485 [Salipiger aestuarii]KAB2542154.1 hypothetical protein AL035_08820 [Salipiger aestuarii]RAK16701.1 hypothetical protein ATI53_101965 [Salipiger aestuarii]